MFPDKKTFKTIKSIEYPEKTNTEVVAISGIELDKPKSDISGFIESYLEKLLWNSYSMDQENHSKMVLEKSKVFSLGKCIKVIDANRNIMFVCRSSSSFRPRT